MPNITEAINRASKILNENEISNPRMEAASLLSVALQKNKTFLIANNEYKLTEKENYIFHLFVSRRADREPFQHIAGVQEFYGLEFKVSPEVLIPRPETELIVEEGIAFLKSHSQANFCELGIGSGCISVALLNNLENAEAIAGDISGVALKIASENAKSHSVNERLKLFESDLFNQIPKQTFTLIVSNPPYIPLSNFDGLQKEVRDFDPRVALTDEKDGLSITRKIVKQSPEWLKSSGMLLIEIGFNQSEKVKAFFGDDIWNSVDLVSDFQGIPRIVKAQVT